MPGSFVFASEFTTENFLSQTQLSKGTGNGIDNPNQFHALGGAFTFDDNAANIVSVALLPGQTMNLDVDFGLSNNVDTINTEIRVIDALGKEAAFNDTAAGTDVGSPTTGDPNLSFTSGTGGLYYVVVTQRANDYVDGTFGFDKGGTDSGIFQLDISIAGLSGLSLGTSVVDNLTLGTTEQRFNARGGDDVIYANIGNTVIDGGNGDDYLNGNSGRDIISGGDGNDNIYGGAARDVLLGGDGNDYISDNDGPSQVFGGQGNDGLYTGIGSDLLEGGDGTDNINGGGGADTVRAGSEDDYIYGNAGADLLRGGDGFDTFDCYNLARVNVDLAVTGPQDTFGAGTDILLSIEHISGSNIGDDALAGNALNNSLYGNGGEDTLEGGDGNDYLNGYAGNDRILGGVDNDSLYGNQGKDVMFGGTGSDYFGYYSADDSNSASPDEIRDFSHADGEHIGLSSVYSETLAFIGSGPFSGTAGELQVNANNVVRVDVDGDAVADMRIIVTSAKPLVVEDFYL